MSIRTNLRKRKRSEPVDTGKPPKVSKADLDKLGYMAIFAQKSTMKKKRMR
jgi:hypothetical protein